MYATAPDSAQLYYQVYDFTDPWRPSDAILLHHGYRANHKMWHALVPLLSRHYRIVVYDARGRGKSTIPAPGFAWSLDQFATDALAVADAVGLDRFHLLGNSFGSIVAEYMAATYPARIKTLILLAPPYRFTHLRHVKEGWLEEYSRIGGLEFNRRDARRLFPEGADPAMLEWHAQEMASMPEHVWRELQPFTAGLNLADLLSDISMPTLIVASIKSDRAPSTEAQFIAQQIPNCELVELDTHHNVASIMPERCAELILDFLGRHPDA